ncbi:hypothetical protein LSH36_216g06073 [Paralvinella palmiformis]|uniref:Uncharacterized protein n=1 Tax=Paralvinella palmiformis TaxID=53620 RepID=A0AAD9N411_9ANNE|nr:hypothetical protein LSH36_216g06073 [Paralvinella palmiformis]
MAEAPKQSNKDIFLCDICMELYNDGNHQPKFLSCHHSYCKSCLSQVALRDKIECPSCRHPTRLPPGGVTALQTNFYISQLKEILKTHSQSRTRGCKRHYYQQMSFYCQKCQRAICRDCTVLDHKEKDGHIVQDIDVAEAEQKEQLSLQMSASNSVVEDAQLCLTQLETERDKVENTITAAKEDIEKLFYDLENLLQRRKDELLSQLNDSCKVKEQQIDENIKSLIPKLTEFHQVLLICDNTLKRGLLDDMIQMRYNLKQSTKELIRQMNNIGYATNDVLFNSIEGCRDYEASVMKIGQIYVNETIPTRCEINIPQLIASIHAKATLSLYSTSGKLLSGEGIDVLLKDDQGDLLQKYLTWNDGKGCFVFMPQVCTNLFITVTFRGQFIPGSYRVAKVKSNNPVAKFGQQGTGEGTFNSPRAVTVNKRGELYIADTGNRVIQKLDPDGNFLYQFEISNGVDDNSTCDLALCCNEDLIVCTETAVSKSNNPKVAQTILIYTTDGQLKDKFNNTSMKCALCIAANQHDEIILSDYRCRSLFMHHYNGQFLRKIGNEGTFNHPSFICVTDDDCIIVSDTNTHTIQVFSREGRFLRQFGKAGKKKGELKQPFGVACDGEYILVVDSGNNRIQVFTKNGTFVSTLDSHDDPMNQPRGLAITGDGHVYVADRDNHCIKKYKYK